jgi:hypothetical protein
MPLRGQNIICTIVLAELTYIFDHIPKTAGCSFNAYLAEAFREGEFLITDTPEEDVLPLPAEQWQKWRIIAGHRMSHLRPVFPQVRWMTIVRDPVERVVSAYLHARCHPDAWDLIGKEVNEKNISLEDFVEADLFWRRGGEPGSIHDQQVRSLLGRELDPSKWADREGVTHLLRSRFHLCGYTEKFEMFLFFLHITEGWPLVLFNNRNVRKERATFQPSSGALELIAQYNKGDRMIYDFVREEFDQRVAAIWTPETAALYSNYVDDLRAFQQATAGTGTELASAIYRGDKVGADSFRTSSADRYNVV